MHHVPSPCEKIDTAENITFPQLRWRDVITSKLQRGHSNRHSRYTLPQKNPLNKVSIECTHT